MSYTPIDRGSSDWDVPVNAAFTSQDARITSNETAIGVINNTLIDKASRSGDTMTGAYTFTNPSGAAVVAQSNGSTNLMEWKDSGGVVRSRVGLNGNIVADSIAFAPSGIQFGGTSNNFGSGTGGIIGVNNASAVPSANPTNGVVIYSEGGVLKARQANGAVLDMSFLSGLDFQPRDHGLEAWTNDPYVASSSSSITNGTVYVVKLMIRRPVTISNLWYAVTTAAVTPTAGQNWIGLYNSAGTRLAQADIGTALTSSGTKSQAITPQALTPGFVWVAFLGNAATPAALTRSSSGESGPNINLTAAERRSAVVSTGQTVLPASFTPSTLSTSNSLTIFSAAN